MTRILAYGAVIALLLIAPHFIYPVFLMKLLCFALFACAFNLILGYGGLLSFGHAAFFGWSAYVIPVLFVASPTLLLSGHPPEIALAVATSVFGVWLVSSALAGYFAGPLSRPMRAGFIVTGLMALVPAAAFEGAVVSDVLGVLGGIVLMAVEALRNRRAAREPVA